MHLCAHVNVYANAMCMCECACIHVRAYEHLCACVYALVCMPVCVCCTAPILKERKWGLREVKWLA